MTSLAYSIFDHACKVQQKYFWLPVVIFITDLSTFGNLSLGILFCLFYYDIFVKNNVTEKPQY